ncbi:Crp/Fnr family transcriptional regulator [Phyllobacterium salinisoli]|uniref:Crp/Fnr family transcriptional regulator n=1 Tax=Phyllobacterium salinisoli TaxID=1899321 RepID=A0A368JZT3_9HYPH|nr:Crp/Fnr family transcriptional regulator [Phyllobacterium salinisoli]RCS22648.1 Crp/Fnr family transcriptional regulator [Phyllobacterium salinisoli]
MANESKSLLALLEAPPISARFNDTDRQALHSLQVGLKRYPPHTVVYSQGDTVRNVYIINSGWGCIYRDLPSGDRQIMDFPLKGDIVGLRMPGAFNYNTYASITEMSVFEMSQYALNAIVHQAPYLSSGIMALMARQRAFLIEHLTNLGRRSALVRTAHLLLEMGVRAKNNGMGTEKGYPCPLTQYELADALGLTAIHVNRMLRELREQNLVAFRYGEVEFINRPVLVRLANFDENYLNMGMFVDQGAQLE